MVPIYLDRGRFEMPSRAYLVTSTSKVAINKIVGNLSGGGTWSFAFAKPCSRAVMFAAGRTIRYDLDVETLLWKMVKFAGSVMVIS